MDRGRVGTLAIGNKAIREGMIKHQQDVHLERISKIKNRKPGSSNTLDNTAPVIVKACLNNPRKIALKLEFNEMTERENRVLLQKISAILTAPPKITDEDYVKMRKIVQNLKGGKQRYEEEIHLKHHRIYLKHLKTMGPYYKPKDWELDYRRQLRQQKFMRQVTYKPRKVANNESLADLADDANNRPRAASANDALRPLRSSEANSRSAAHVNRIREVKNAPSARAAGKNHHAAQEQTLRHQGQQQGVDEYEADFDGEAEAQEQLEELAHVERVIRVTSTSISVDVTYDQGDETELEKVEEYQGQVDCWLVDKSVLVISARSAGGGGKSGFDAEAEIDVMGLAEIRGISEEQILSDVQQLASLAKYIAESVEVRIEDGEARVILNLAGEGSIGGGVGGEGEGKEEAPSFFVTADGAEFDASQSLELNGSTQLDPEQPDALLATAASQEEVDSALLDDANIRLTTGVTIPVQLIYPANFKKNQQGSPLRGPKKDDVLAIADISLEEEEEILVSVQICSESATKFRGKSAVVADSRMQLKTGLPSIMQADLEMLSEYFGNIAKNLVIEHHVVTGATTLAFAGGRGD